jgi:AraC-like DNA-binding protein/mannose-6-phosphate isomerase-like protein (cupin superfamily)
MGGKSEVAAYMEGSKRGYLNEDFLLFHLRDQKNLQFEFHYHEFNKILVFISGEVTYLIEGRAYHLKPWDIIIVSSNEVHKPIINPSKPYERIVIWVNSAYLEKHNTENCDLTTCFDPASRNKVNLVRPSPENLQRIKAILLHLEQSLKDNGFGSRILANSVFMQLVVYLNREFLSTSGTAPVSDVQYDENIGKVIDYINEHISEDLSIDKLSSEFYISKYYLMHKFKKQTGYSIHNYILQKRLILAGPLIREGKPATEVSIECGFKDYSNFIRAFKKMYGLPPKQYLQNIRAQNLQRNERHF